jgi:hypothetical protein
MKGSIGMEYTPEPRLPTNNIPHRDLPHHTPLNPRETPAETTRQHEYQRYRQSPRWLALAHAVRMRAKGKCEICYRANGQECAHLTYDRVFNERMTDLQWLCPRCHRELDTSLGFGS